MLRVRMAPRSLCAATSVRYWLRCVHSPRLDESGFLRAHVRLNQNGISIGSSVFAQHTAVPNAQRRTDRAPCDIGSNRPAPWALRAGYVANYTAIDESRYSCM